ncbi:hypothetical protein GCM10025858_26240 [Alicyclobacillus sacchari]|nr:hypothetical protein GCM10025858_26240 [Alicyclobacillus sacchari]
MQALVKRKMIDIADTVVVLADHSKIQVQDFTHVADLREIDWLITDGDTSEVAVAAFEQLGVKVVRAL